MSLSINQSSESIKVILRCRPMNEKEILSGCLSVVKVNPSSKTVEVYDSKNEQMDHCQLFTFDATYDYSCNNQNIFNENIQSLVEAVLKGFNGTIFAYGQSGAGKTHTMEGNETDKGITARTVEHIFDVIAESSETRYLVRTSYLEIYRDEIRDLLAPSKKNCELRENAKLGVYVKNITSFVCKSVKQMNALIDLGKRNRSTGCTGVNARSSRSHAIVTITVEMGHIDDQSKRPVRVGRLNLVDLAGSERQKKTNASGEKLKEACRINWSLTALGNVISALADNKDQFIPYRDSKLTRLLRNSLGGNSKTIIIANIGPTDNNHNDSLNTLRFASRARNIKNKPQINEDPVDALLKRYQEEIERLKTLLARKNQAKHKEKLKKDITTIPLKSDIFIPLDKGEDINSLKKSKQSHEYNVDDLKKRIEFMESKLLTGSGSIIERTLEQQQALQVRADEIYELKQREIEIKEMIAANKESTEEVREDLTHLKQVVENKAKELLNKYHQLQSIQQEIVDAREEFNRDRREFEVTEYELWKDMKLRILIIENFIPYKDRRRMLSQLYFDEELDTWKTLSNTELHKVLAKQKSDNNGRRPLTMYSKITRRKVNHTFRCNRTSENREKTFRFRAENILELQLFQSGTKLKDYYHSKITSELNVKLREAFQEEQSIEIDAKNPTFLKNKAKIRFENILKSYCNYVDRATTKNSAAVYPLPRGLVPK